MSSKRRVPLAVIVGRPNVGKSTLFNRLTGKQRAIVHGEEGITRDRVYGVAETETHVFRVADTGGITDSPLDPITRKVQEQVHAALEEAHVIVFVVDARQEITRTDEDIRDHLIRLGKPIVLAANKLDNPQLEAHAADLYALGVGDPIPISSGHGHNMDELLAAITAHMPRAARAEEQEELAKDDWGGDGDEEPAAGPGEDGGEEDAAPRVTKVAIVGKPNVGKSSFINAILNEERTIVTEVPGTTRDAIDIEFRWKDRDYLLIDTAGLRRKAGIREDVEHFSVSRTLRAVRRADVCLLMMDAVEGVTEQDKRIFGYIRDQGPGLILVWTKWDLVEDRAARFKELQSEMDLKAPYLRFAPFLTVSNVSRKRLFTTFEYIDRVAAAARLRIGTGELNRFFDSIRTERLPAMRRGQQAKIRYVAQTGVKPAEFVLFVNQKKLFHFSFLRFIENRLRERFDFEGVPIRLELREGEPKR